MFVVTVAGKIGNPECTASRTRAVRVMPRRRYRMNATRMDFNIDILRAWKRNVYMFMYEYKSLGRPAGRVLIRTGEKSASGRRDEEQSNYGRLAVVINGARAQCRTRVIPDTN